LRNMMLHQSTFSLRARCWSCIRKKVSACAILARRVAFINQYELMRASVYGCERYVSSTAAYAYARGSNDFSMSERS
jgi:hypothetical protein